MAKYLCLNSFAGVGFNGTQGKEIDLDDKAVIDGLVNAGYIRATEGVTAVEEKPAAAPAKKKAPAKRKTAKKG